MPFVLEKEALVGGNPKSDSAYAHIVNSVEKRTSVEATAVQCRPASTLEVVDPDFVGEIQNDGVTPAYARMLEDDSVRR